jgi:hypothetical protein
MNKFKDLEELQEFMEDNSYNVDTDPEVCDHCDSVLVDAFGCTTFIGLDIKELGEPKFCDEDCMQEYLIAKVGVDED